MTHLEELNRIEITNIREMNKIFKAEIIKVKDKNRKIQAKY